LGKNKNEIGHIKRGKEIACKSFRSKKKIGKRENYPSQLLTV